MKKILAIIILAFVTCLINAQDIIYTIGAELNDTKTELDSIIVENLSNGKFLLFKDLPKQDYYQINLSQKTLLGAVGVDLLKNYETFVTTENSPGLLRIEYRNINFEDAVFSIYNMNGQQIHASEKITFKTNHLFQIKLNVSGVFFVKIETLSGIRIFKAMGSADVKEQVVEIFEANNKFKSSFFENEDDFEITVGDRIRIFIYKDDYYALPSTLYFSFSESLDFTFNVPFKDSRDNKIYQTAKIGDQTWMAENLTYLPTVSSSNVGSLTERHYYVYGYENNSIVNARNTINFGIYGVLYNWTAAMNETKSSDSFPSGVQGICPPGWHLPSKTEWTMLINYLNNNGFGYEINDNDIAKSLAAKTNWSNSDYIGTPGNNPQSNNLSAFSALPGGYRSSHDEFRNIKFGTYWWSSTENGSNYAEYLALIFDLGITQSFFSSKAIGLSVRCVRD